MSQAPPSLTPEPVVYALRPPRPGMLRPVLTGVFLGLVAASVAQPLLPEPMVIGAGLAVALAAGTLSQWLAKRRIADGVELTDDRVVLRQGDRRLRSIDLRRLVEVNEFDTDVGQVVLLADRSRALALMQGQFVRPTEFAALRDGLVDRLHRLDPTGELGRRAAQAARVREALVRRPVRATPILGSLLALATLLSSLILLPGLQGRAFPLEAAGALSRPLVLAGEWWRLFAYPFLHPTAMHVAVSLAGLLWVGSFLERLVGWERMVLAFAAGVGCGAAASLAFAGPGAATGAMSGVFGLVGMLGAVALRRRRELPRSLLPGAGFWVATALVAPMLPGTGALSFAAHAGGALGGLLAGTVALTGPLPGPRDSERRWLPFALLSAAALLIGLVGSVTHGRRQHPDDAWIVADGYLQLPPGDTAAVAQNDTAYLLVMAPHPSSEAVAVAAALAESAVRQSNRQDASMLDTLAVARFRQGNLPQARGLVEEALHLPVSDELRKFLEQRLADLTEGRDLQSGME